MSDAKKIVLAEDNSTLSLLLKFRLEKEGYKLLIAVDGKEAIELEEFYKLLSKCFEVTFCFSVLKYEIIISLYKGSIDWSIGNSCWNFRPYLTSVDSITCK
jgi:hypothetical protein